MKKFILYMLPILNIYSIFGDINITVNEDKTINNENLPNGIAFNNETGELTIQNFKDSNETVSIKTPHKVHLKEENSFNKLKIDGRFSNNGVTQANNVEFKGKGGVNYGAILVGKELSEKEKINLPTNTEPSNEETPNNHDFTITNYGIIKSRTMDLKNNANVTNEPHQYKKLPIGAYISKSTIDIDKANLSNGSKVNIRGGNFKTKDLQLDANSKIEGRQRNKDGIVTYFNQQDKNIRTELKKLFNMWNNLINQESNLKTNKEKANFYFQKDNLEEQYNNILNNLITRITETPNLFKLLTKLNNSNTSIRTSQSRAVPPPPPPPPAPARTIPPPPPPPPAPKERNIYGNKSKTNNGAPTQGKTKGQNPQATAPTLEDLKSVKLNKVDKENKPQEDKPLSHIDLIKKGGFNLKKVVKEQEETKEQKQARRIEELKQKNPKDLTVQEALELEMLRRRKDIENDSDDEEEDEEED